MSTGTDLETALRYPEVDRSQGHTRRCQHHRGLGGLFLWDGKRLVIAGPGPLTWPLASHVRAMRGVDPSPQLPEQVAAIDAEAVISVTYRVGTAEQTGFVSM